MRTQSTSIILCLLAGSAALSAQYVYMSSGVENSVYEYSIGGAGYLSFIGTVPAGANPGAVVVDPLNRFVYVADSGNSADPNQPPGITQFRIGGFGNLISIGAVRTPVSPNTMGIDQKGRNLYVA